ncbi:MAG TPA: hypothetical protein PLH79_01105 [bacterium]|nr:hypothetical protein [bacterium]
MNESLKYGMAVARAHGILKCSAHQPGDPPFFLQVLYSFPKTTYDDMVDGL